MNCEQANQIDLVDYLHSIGHQPKKIKGADHWYLSPFREEKEPSFKVEINKNVWYDHGIDKGGKLVDFLMELYQCKVNEALQKISFFHPQNSLQNNVVRSQFHLHKDSVLNDRNATETAIKIIAAKQPLQDHFLCRYLHQRDIEKSVAEFCYDVSFQNFPAGEKKIYKALGFKNNAALPNRQISFLILNSLSFFERSLLLMEKYEGIHLYLDKDTGGRKCTAMALKRSIQFSDESKLYKGYKDFNEGLMNLGKLKKKINVGQSMHRHL